MRSILVAYLSNRCEIYAGKKVRWLLPGRFRTPCRECGGGRICCCIVHCRCTWPFHLACLSSPPHHCPLQTPALRALLCQSCWPSSEQATEALLQPEPVASVTLQVRLARSVLTERSVQQRRGFLTCDSRQTCDFDPSWAATRAAPPPCVWKTVRSSSWKLIPHPRPRECVTRARHFDQRLPCRSSPWPAPARPHCHSTRLQRRGARGGSFGGCHHQLRTASVSARGKQRLNES